MGITSRCTECGSESSGTGGIVHATTCTMTLLSPQSGLDYLRPPAIELKFGSQAEQEKFMTNLSGTLGGNDLVATDLSQDEPVKSAIPSDNLNKDIGELDNMNFKRINDKQIELEIRKLLWEVHDTHPLGAIGSPYAAINNPTQAILEIINNEKIAELEKILTIHIDNSQDDYWFENYLKERIATLKKGEK